MMDDDHEDWMVDGYEANDELVDPGEPVEENNLLEEPKEEEEHEENPEENLEEEDPQENLKDEEYEEDPEENLQEEGEDLKEDPQGEHEEDFGSPVIIMGNIIENLDEIMEEEEEDEVEV